jgi:hypothetical protein
MRRDWRLCPHLPRGRGHSTKLAYDTAVAMLSRSPIERPCVAALYAPTEHIVIRSSAPV